MKCDGSKIGDRRSILNDSPARSIELRKDCDRATIKNKNHDRPHIPLSPMITYVTLPEATANIVQLLDRVCQGEEIIISQAGITIAHISPPPKRRQPRSPGQYEGQFTVPNNFNDPLPEDILNDFLNPTDPLLSA